LAGDASGIPILLVGTGAPPLLLGCHANAHARRPPPVLPFDRGACAEVLIAGRKPHLAAYHSLFSFFFEKNILFFSEGGKTKRYLEVT